MRKILERFFLALVVLVLLSPNLLLAQSVFPSNSNQYTIDNPLGTEDVNQLLVNIMDLVAKAGGVLVVLFIIYSGYKFVKAGENESERTKAKDIFYGTVIGGLILLGADIIANIIIETVKSTAGLK